MSIHRSLVSKGKLVRHRNVLTRAERLQVLLEENRWKTGASPFALPKVRSIKHKVKKTKKKEEAATPAAAPAAGAAAKPADKGVKAPAAAEKAKPADKGAKK